VQNNTFCVDDLVLRRLDFVPAVVSTSLDVSTVAVSVEAVVVCSVEVVAVGSVAAAVVAFVEAVFCCLSPGVSGRDVSFC